jgi:hypothetical protein
MPFGRGDSMKDWQIFAILGGYVICVALVSALFYGGRNSRKIHEEAVEKELQRRSGRGSTSVLRE